MNRRRPVRRSTSDGHDPAHPQEQDPHVHHGHGHGLRRGRRARRRRRRPGVVALRRVGRLDHRRHPGVLDGDDAQTSTARPTRRSRPTASSRTPRATRPRTATTAARPARPTTRSRATPSTAATATSSPTTRRDCSPSCAATSVSSRWASCSPTSSATPCRPASATSRRPPSTWSSRRTASRARGPGTSPTAPTRTCTSPTDDLDTALAGLLTLSDPSGVDGAQDGAHGNGFDRVGAFQDGYEGAAAACADYQNHPPAVTESGYTSYQDQATGGNLALADLLPTVTTSLASYWSAQAQTTAPTVVASNAAPDCTGTTDGGVLTDAVTYCPSTDTITYDPSVLQQVHDSIGDFAGGMLLAAAWSSSVRHQLGHDLGTTAARTRRRVPRRGVGGGPRDVTVAGRPRRGGHAAGVPPATGPPTAAAPSTGWRRSGRASSTARRSA